MLLFDQVFELYFSSFQRGRRSYTEVGCFVFARSAELHKILVLLHGRAREREKRNVCACARSSAVVRLLLHLAALTASYYPRRATLRLAKLRSKLPNDERTEKEAIKNNRKNE